MAVSSSIAYVGTGISDAHFPMLARELSGMSSRSRCGYSVKSTSPSTLSAPTPSAEAAGGTPCAADVTDASLFIVVVQSPACVMPEHVVQGGALAEHRLEQARRARGSNRPRVHERYPVAVGICLVHVMGRHQHRHVCCFAQSRDELPHISARDRIQANCRLVKDEQAGGVDQRL